MLVENGRAVPSNDSGIGIAWNWKVIDARASRAVVS